MAGQTISTQAQKSFLFLLNIWVNYKILFVAAIAILLFMRPFQFISGKSMVETVFIETNHFKFSTMVVTVTTYAVFSENCLGCVITFVFVNAFFKMCMTCKTIIISNLLSKCMAFRTIGHAFKVGMGFG